MSRRKKPRAKKPTPAPALPAIADPALEYERLLGLLEPKPARFVREYLMDLNGAAAARRAGYETSRPDQQAYENLRKPEIAIAVEAGKRAIAAKLAIRTDVIVAEYERCGLSDIGNYLTWGPGGLTMMPSDEVDPEHRRAIAEIQETVIPQEEGDPIRRLKFKLHDKKGALDSLAKHTGLFKDAGLQDAANKLQALLESIPIVLKAMLPPEKIEGALVLLARTIDGKYERLAG